MRSPLRAARQKMLNAMSGRCRGPKTVKYQRRRLRPVVHNTAADRFVVLTLGLSSCRPDLDRELLLRGETTSLFTTDPSCGSPSSARSKRREGLRLFDR